MAHTNKRLLLAAILLAFSGIGLGVRGQSRIVVDAQVRFEKSEASPSSNRGSEDRTVRSGGSDSGRPTRRRQGRINVAAYDRRLVAAVYRECARYRIDPALVFSLIWQESGAKLQVVSVKGAGGALQLMPETAAQYGVRNRFDPDQAVRGGVAYLVSLLDHFQGNVALALAAYNAGSVSVDAFLGGKRIVLRTGKVINPAGRRTAGGIPPYKETQAYVENIASYYRGFRKEAGAATVESR